MTFLRAFIDGPATAIPATPAIPQPIPEQPGPSVAPVARIAVAGYSEDPGAVDYSPADLAEVRRLARRWHELAWPDLSATGETLRRLRCIAPAAVLAELAAFRDLVAMAGGER